MADLDRGNVQVEDAVARKDHFAVDSIEIVGCILDLVLRTAGLRDAVVVVVAAAAAAVSCTGTLLLVLPVKIAVGASIGLHHRRANRAANLDFHIDHVHSHYTIHLLLLLKAFVLKAIPTCARGTDLSSLSLEPEPKVAVSTVLFSSWYAMRSLINKASK